MNLYNYKFQVYSKFLGRNTVPEEDSNFTRERRCQFGDSSRQM